MAMGHLRELDVAIVPVRIRPPVRRDAQWIDRVRDRLKPHARQTAHIRKILSRMGEWATPIPQWPTPVQESVTPVGEWVRSIQESVTPVGEWVRPVPQWATPVQESVTPVGEWATSIQQCASAVGGPA
jgi:hypothetical protein